MPVAGIVSAKSITNSVPAQSLAHVRIVIDINIVVEIDELILGDGIVTAKVATISSRQAMVLRFSPEIPICEG